MNSIRAAVTVLAVGAGMGAALLAGPGYAEPVAWDKAEVAKLADQLVVEVRAIKNNIAGRRDEADPHSARWIVLDDLMQLQERAVAYEGLVRAGEERAETEPVYRRIVTAVDNARRDAPGFPEIQQQHERLERVAAVLKALSGYYGTD